MKEIKKTNETTCELLSAPPFFKEDDRRQASRTSIEFASNVASKPQGKTALASAADSMLLKLDKQDAGNCPGHSVSSQQWDSV
ncbi:rCG63722 [Rattus norvegicus]|uniref:RCG63722 n=1 Tax=Rattus norvegicus TaxID=10116 RepID=A6I9T1_RAT|nr:rCG63722 [Rattus norvegicus]